jgi:hypothetical protein
MTRTARSRHLGSRRCSGPRRTPRLSPGVLTAWAAGRSAGWTGLCLAVVGFTLSGAAMVTA